MRTLFLLGYLCLNFEMFSQDHSGWYQLNNPNFQTKFQVTNFCAYDSKYKTTVGVYFYQNKYFYTEVKHDQQRCRIKTNPYHGVEEMRKNYSHCLFWRRKYIQKTKLKRCKCD